MPAPEPVTPSTPRLPIVTAPVAPLTLMPVPATLEVTPVFESVTVPPNDTGEPATPRPVPPVTVIAPEPGRSASTSARNVGAAGTPVPGPAKIVFAVSLASVPVSVPVVVTGEPDTVKIAGSARPTLVTPVLLTVIEPAPFAMLIPVPPVRFASV